MLASAHEVEEECDQTQLQPMTAPTRGIDVACCSPVHSPAIVLQKVSVSNAHALHVHPDRVRPLPQKWAGLTA